MPIYEFTVPERGSFRRESFSIWGQNPEEARQIFEKHYRGKFGDGREGKAVITRTEPDKPDYLV